MNGQSPRKIQSLAAGHFYILHGRDLYMQCTLEFPLACGIAVGTPARVSSSQPDLALLFAQSFMSQSYIRQALMFLYPVALLLAAGRACKTCSGIQFSV